jgi:hypothetical protein
MRIRKESNIIIRINHRNSKMTREDKKKKNRQYSIQIDEPGASGSHL